MLMRVALSLGWSSPVSRSSYKPAGGYRPAASLDSDTGDKPAGRGPPLAMLGLSSLDGRSWSCGLLRRGRGQRRLIRFELRQPILKHITTVQQHGSFVFVPRGHVTRFVDVG